MLDALIFWQLLAKELKAVKNLSIAVQGSSQTPLFTNIISVITNGTSKDSEVKWVKIVTEFQYGVDNGKTTTETW